MMPHPLSAFQAVVLAVVQGVTEFLPISSSGHLILVPYFLRWPDQGLSFDIATNTGTLLAILAYFRQDVRDLVIGFFTGQSRRPDADFPPRKLAWDIAVATIPAGLAGLLFKGWIATQARNPLLIAAMTIFYAVVLAAADQLARQDRSFGDMTWRAALLIGVAQALALVPGTSRSGITIAMALFLGFTRPAAARFSFLMTIPISVLVAALDAKDLIEAGVTGAELVPMAIGLVVSAVVGYLVIAWLLAWLRRQRLTVFVVYRLLLGAVILATVFFRS